MKITKSSNLKSIPEDLSSFGFGELFTDHMLVKEFKNGEWQESQILPYAPISLDPSCSCLHYGQEVFEGMRAYKNAEGEVLLFRPEENFRRLNLSNERIGIPKIDEKEILSDLMEFLRLEKDWIPETFGTSIYIRPFIIATEAGLGLRSSSEYMFITILTPSGTYSKKGLQPINIYVEDEYVRAVKGGTGMAKTGGNYAGSLIAQNRAKKLGFDQVLWLDAKHRKYIEEVGAMNVMFVTKDKVITPALTGSILDGITRKSTIEIIKSFGLELEEREISIDEVIELSNKGELLEMFGTGTAVVILPIANLHYKGEDISIGSGGVIGELTKRLYDEITGIQYGRQEDTFNWTVKI